MGWFDSAVDMGGGFLKRAAGVGKGLVTIPANMGGFVWDVARAPWIDDPAFDGMVHTLFGRAVHRGGNVMMDIMGPEAGVGALIGGIPEPIRSPVATFLEPSMEASEWVYRESISEPISTFITLGSMMDSQAAKDRYGSDVPGGVDLLFNRDAWGDAHAISQARSPGQALTTYLGAIDIYDEAEMNQFQGSDFYQIGSGFSDAMFRFWLDPLVIGAGGYMGLRKVMSLKAIDSNWKAIENVDELTAWANGYKKMADRHAFQAEEFGRQGNAPFERLARLRSQRMEQTLSRAGFDSANNYYTEILGQDSWRSTQLTDEVTAWQARIQQSYDALKIRDPAIKPTSRAQWAREAMDDLNQRLTRIDPSTVQRVVEHGEDGLPIIRTAAGTGKAIGGVPFEIENFTTLGMRELTPDNLITLADFGPGVEWARAPTMIEFKAKPRGFVPFGQEPENLARIAADDNLLGRTLVNKPFMAERGMIPNSVAGRASTDFQMTHEGTGAPIAEVVGPEAFTSDSTIVGGDQVHFAVSILPQDVVAPTVLRASKKINSHAGMAEPSVTILSQRAAEIYYDNAKALISVSNEFKDHFDDMPTDPSAFTDFAANVIEEIDQSGRTDVTRVIERVLNRHPEWAGTIDVQKALKEILEEVQQEFHGPVFKIDWDNLPTIDEIRLTRVSPGQLADTGARITQPYVNVDGNWTLQHNMFEVHGDIRLIDPPIIPAKPKIPEGTIMTQPGIDVAMMDRQTRLGIVRQSPMQKMLRYIDGKKHNPDPLFTGTEQLPRDLITHSKVEQEAARLEQEAAAMVRTGQPDSALLKVPDYDMVAPHMVPDTLYHTTPFADGIELTGKIEARLGGGLGGDPYNLKRPGVSLSDDKAAAWVTERFLKDVVAPMVADLGPAPTGKQVMDWINNNQQLVGIPQDVLDRTLNMYDPSHWASGAAYETILSSISPAWRDAHGFITGPEPFVNVPDDVIATIKVNNIKTYELRGEDIVNAPGTLARPLGGSEFRYYGDIPIDMNRRAVPQGGYPAWSEDIEAGQALAETEKLAATDPTYASPEMLAQFEREKVRVQWQYDHANPEPMTQAKIWEVAADIRHRFFPKHAQGDTYAYALATAKNHAEAEIVVRVFQGDFKARNLISLESMPLRKTLDELVARTAVVRQKIEYAIEMDRVDAYGRISSEVYQNDLDSLHAMIDQTAGELQVKDRILQAFGTMKEAPSTGALSNLRANISGSELYQLSPWTKPVRVIFNMMPHRMLNVSGTMADAQFARMLTQANMHPDQVAQFRGRFMGAPMEQRWGIVAEADDQLILERMHKAGLDREEIDLVMRVASRGKQKAAGILRRQQYDALPSNSLVSQMQNQSGKRMGVIEDSNEYVVAPLWAETQTSQAVFLTDYRALDRALAPVGRFRARHAAIDRSIRVPTEMMQGVQTVWRYAVLARPAWPMRVIFDEQLRMMAKTGAMAEMAGFWNGVKGLTNYTLKSLGMKEEVVPNIIRQLEDLPDVTQQAKISAMTEQFMAKTEKSQTAFDLWDMARIKESEAANIVRDRKMLYDDALARNNETPDPFTHKQFLGAKQRYEQSRVAFEKAQLTVARREQTYMLKPTPVNEASWLDAQTSAEEARVILIERQAQAKEAAEIAQRTRHPETTATMKARKSEYDKAQAVLKNLAAERATLEVKMKTRMGDTFGEGLDIEALAQETVNPAVAEAAPAAGGLSRATKVGAIGGGMLGGIVGGPVGAGAGATLGASFMKAIGHLDEGGYKQFTVNNHRVAAAFGNPGDKARTYIAETSARDALYEFLSKAEKDAMDGFRVNPNQWRTVVYDDPHYATSYTNAMAQISSDALGRKILETGLEGKEEVLKWMLDTPEGRTYAGRLEMRRGMESEWIDQATDQIDRYTKGFDPVIVEAALAGKANARMLDRFHPTERPPVHGPELESALGGGVWKTMQDKVDQAFFALGTAPTDWLSRQPFFAHMYETEMRRLIGNTPDGYISQEILTNWETSARQYALEETRYLLYDMAERSEFTEMVRFFMPFFGAWQEVLTRWAGLAIENPKFAMRAVQVFNAPNKIPGMVYTDETNGESYIQFRVPEVFKGLLSHGMFAGALDTTGTIKFSKSSISMLASGAPGFGPFVNLAVSQVAKNRPELDEALEILLPFGVSDSFVDPFLPAAARRAVSIVREDDDAAYASTYHSVLVARLTQIMDGNDSKWTYEDMQNPEIQAQFYEEVNDQTRKLFSIRLVSALVSPVALSFDSLYKPYVDKYRELREQDPTTADDKFFQQYGEELIYLTQAVTQTNNGVPPTLHGADQTQKFGDLITKYPEYGSVIVGPDAGGESSKFLSQVYNKQLNTPIAPGSDVMQRERLSPLETFTDPQIRLGWQHFSRYMDKIDGYMIQNGFTTYQQAPNMREFKNQVVRELATKYPAWADEYFTRDERKWDKRIEAFTAMVSDPELAQRPDMQGVATYLRVRSMMVAELQRRDQFDGSASLFAASNEDIFLAWSEFRIGLKESNLQFADLYNRYLDRDPLTIDPIMGGSE